MTVLSTLQPQAVWHWFEKICSIPHPSKHEDKLKAMLIDWATNKGIDYREDKVGNLIFTKPATAGMENRKPVVIQAHLDMVPQKNNDKQHDFVTDAIEPRIVDGWVMANETTLGADNGIGMASALSVLDADDIEHGPLEVLLTVDEEAGMTGAFGLEPGLLNAEILINTDSEQEGEIYMGCAGGVDVSFDLPIERSQVCDNARPYLLKIEGLKGGHSGCDIHLGRGNANKLLARFLTEYQDFLSVRLVSFQGGSLRNAIPREGKIEFFVPSQYESALTKAVSEFTQKVKQELELVEPNIEISLSTSEHSKGAFTKESQKKFVALMQACPNGVIRMSDAIAGVVETSLNLGVVNSADKAVNVLCLVRSLDDNGRENVVNMLRSLGYLANCDVKASGAYPGWKPDNNSPVMALVRELYQGLYNKTPNIMVIHAGLECGLFKEPYPDMDMVSIGPTIRFPHSPDEKVEIASVALYWQLLTELLKNIPEK